MTHLPDSEGNPENPQISEKRNISVKITDGTDPVSGATVTLLKNNTIIASSTTGSAGGCNLNNVEDGSYTLTVIKDGFVEYSESITTSVDNADLTIELTRISSP